MQPLSATIPEHGVGAISQYVAVSQAQGDRIAVSFLFPLLKSVFPFALLFPSPRHLRCPVTDPVFWMIALLKRVQSNQL